MSLREGVGEPGIGSIHIYIYIDDIGMYGIIPIFIPLLFSPIIYCIIGIYKRIL